MTKYSNEFKVKAIKMVLKGNSISHVAKILNMPDIAPLCRWISHYEHGGIPQLLHKNLKYTPIFKQKVIEYKWLHHLSLNQTAAKFSIPNTGTISTWEKLYHSYNVAVRPDRQKEGIGHFLMDSLIRLAEQQGVTTIHLEVRTGNGTAIRLYERMGFTKDGIRKKYYTDPVEDALLMTRHPRG